ncbi:hypothetical protein T484DRAFT_1817619, partial [Baffinella frigidus]
MRRLACDRAGAKKKTDSKRDQQRFECGESVRELERRDKRRRRDQQCAAFDVWGWWRQLSQGRKRRAAACRWPEARQAARGLFRVGWRELSQGRKRRAGIAHEKAVQRAQAMVARVWTSSALGKWFGQWQEGIAEKVRMSTAERRVARRRQNAL